MANLPGVVQQLRKERDRAQEEVKGLNAALAALAGLKAGPARKRRTLSAAARRKISLAQKARWARRTLGSEAPTARPKRAHCQPPPDGRLLRHNAHGGRK